MCLIKGGLSEQVKDPRTHVRKAFCKNHEGKV